MKTLLRTLFILLFLMIGIIIAGLFLPREHKIVVKKQIDIPRTIVFGLVNDFTNWKDWSPWMLNDKQMEVTTGDKPAGKDAKIQWKSNIYGNCKLAMTHSVLPESVAVNFDFETKSKTVSLWYFEPTDEGTLVNWTINITHLSIWERYFVLINKKEMQLLIEYGAKSLDSLSRSFSRSRIGEIQISQYNTQPSIIMTDSVRADKITSRIFEMHNYINGFFERRELKANGNPFALFYGNVNDSLVKIASGIPIAERTWVWKTLGYFEMPSTKVVTVSHYGYPTDKAHRAILKYIESNNLEKNGFPFEEYLYNPVSNNDTINWETKVYYPVK